MVKQTKKDMINSPGISGRLDTGFGVSIEVTNGYMGRTTEIRNDLAKKALDYDSSGQRMGLI